MIDPGMTVLATVSVTTLGTARATAPIAHPPQAAAVPTICTARECSLNASPTADPPATATTSQARRVTHTTARAAADTTRMYVAQGEL